MASDLAKAIATKLVLDDLALAAELYPEHVKTTDKSEYGYYCSDTLLVKLKQQKLPAMTRMLQRIKMALSESN